MNIGKSLFILILFLLKWGNIMTRKMKYRIAVIIQSLGSLFLLSAIIYNAIIDFSSIMCYILAICAALLLLVACNMKDSVIIDLLKETERQEKLDLHSIDLC